MSAASCRFGLAGRRAIVTGHRGGIGGAVAPGSTGQALVADGGGSVLP